MDTERLPTEASSEPDSETSGTEEGRLMALRFDANAARRGGTRADELRTRIADEITSGLIPPGTRLDEVQLAERFDVSRTPVREALKQLSTIGLVTRGARRTMTVAEISSPQLDQMFELMGELEATCARLAAVKMTSEDRARIERAHEICRERMRQGDAVGYGEANASFHAIIYAGSHNPYVVEATQQIRIRLAPFRKAQFYTPDRMAKSFEEHDHIVRAILRADQVMAADIVREHIVAARMAYANFFASVQSGAD